MVSSWYKVREGLVGVQPLGGHLTLAEEHPPDLNSEVTLGY